MRDFLGGSNRRKLIDWLAIDSWIDSGLYAFWIGFKDWWSGYSTFFGRFQVKGFRRVLNEIAGEALTIGTAGLVIGLAFSLPAFEIAQGTINLADEYSVTFLDRTGAEIGKRGLLRDDSVPFEEIPDHMIKATLATEDRRFYKHFGVDVLGTFRALAENARANDIVQGGSSITQQLAKNMFLTPERALGRKIKEAFIAIYLENHYTKPELLKLYFDRAYLAGGSYGVEAAAQFYFRKSIRDVNLAEAAMLAGMFKAPTRFAPHINLAASRARANEVLTNIVEAGYATEGQVFGARLNPAKIVDRGDFYSPDWFLDWGFEEVKRIMHGKKDHILVARTTVDIDLQKKGEQSLVQTMQQYGRARHFDGGALVAMENDGAVRALVGGTDYGRSQFNRATQAYRQPGSSFKPYVYLTALQNGYTPNTIVSDGYVTCNRWSPRNYSGGFRGRMTVRKALAKSINTIAVKLSLKVGREKVLANLNKMGITHLRKSCSMALGDTGMTPLQHTGGYAVFAAGGLEVRPYGIEEIRTLHNDLIYNHESDEPPRQQIFDRKVVETLNNMLQTVVLAGTGRRSQLDYTNSSGKTGTSTAFRDAWFMGFTGQYVVGVWLGNDDFSPMARVTGGSFPAQTWHNFLMLAHDTDNIPQIPGVDLHPLQVAEQERIALAQQLNPNAEILAPTPESVKDMPPATREALDKLAALLRKVVPLNPSDRPRDKRTQAPSSGPAAQSQSSVASAARSQSEAASADPPQLQAPQSADSDGGASPPP